MRHEFVRAGLALSVAFVVGISGRVVLSGVTESMPTYVPAPVEQRRAVELHAAVDVPEPVLQVPDPTPATAPQAPVSSPVLMVWRDRATGEFKSRTLPADSKAVIAIELVGSSRNVPATASMQENSRVAAAGEKIATAEDLPGHSGAGAAD